MRSALLRAQLETALGERVLTPFIDIEQRERDLIPSGIDSLDAVTGGLPRGAITEIYGAPSTGKSSIAVSILAAFTKRDEICAIIDGTDAFDPASASAAGVDLQRLLWIRCRSLQQLLRSTDLLLQGGGFGLIVLDLSDLPQQAIRGVPLASWFRFQRAIEGAPACLLLIGRESAAKSAAALAVQTHSKQTVWNGANGGPSHGLLLSGNHLSLEIARMRQNALARPPQPAHHVRVYTSSR